MTTPFTALRVAALLLFAAAIPVSAPAASKPDKNNPAYERLPGKSLALNIALATGLTTEKGPLRDAARSELDQDLRDVPTATFSLFSTRNKQAIEGVRGLAGNMLPKLAAQLSPKLAGHLGPNLSPTMGGIALFSAVFGPTEQPHPVLKRHVIAWMPAELASDRKQAVKVMDELLMKAMYSAYTEDEGWSQRPQRYTYNTTLMGLQVVDVQALEGGDACGTKAICFGKTVISKPIEVAHAPTYLGGGQSYLWRNYLPGETDFDILRCEVFVNAVLPDRPTRFYEQPYSEFLRDGRRFWTAITARMPPWFFYYMPPDAQRAYPTLINQGRELVFVEPLPDEQETVVLNAPVTEKTPAPSTIPDVQDGQQESDLKSATQPTP